MQEKQPSPRLTYRITINGLTRDLPLFEVEPGKNIAVFNLLGDSEITLAAAEGLAKRLSPLQGDTLVTAESKSIALTYQISLILNIPWVVLRKHYRSYMGEAKSAKTLSITTGTPQDLYLDEKDEVLIFDKRVILVDDVISTGSTLKAMKSLIIAAGGEIVASAAVLTEGVGEYDRRIIALGHLPLFE